MCTRFRALVAVCLLSTATVAGLLAAQGAAAGVPVAGVSVARPDFQLPFPCGERWKGQTRRDHQPRNAVDFNRMRDEGAPVLAAAAGTVSEVADKGDTGYGRWIQIDHGRGWSTRYAHLSRQAVSVGDAVSQGQWIGRVGDTGDSTGPHLHFEERKNDVDVRISVGGAPIRYWGSKRYESANSC